MNSQKNNNGQKNVRQLFEDNLKVILQNMSFIKKTPNVESMDKFKNFISLFQKMSKFENNEFINLIFEEISHQLLELFNMFTHPSGNDYKLDDILKAIYDLFDSMSSYYRENYQNEFSLNINNFRFIMHEAQYFISQIRKSDCFRLNNIRQVYQVPRQPLLEFQRNRRNVPAIRNQIQQQNEVLSRSSSSSSSGPYIPNNRQKPAQKKKNVRSDSQCSSSSSQSNQQLVQKRKNSICDNWKWPSQCSQEPVQKKKDLSSDSEREISRCDNWFSQQNSQQHEVKKSRKRVNQYQSDDDFDFIMVRVKKQKREECKNCADIDQLNEELKKREDQIKNLMYQNDQYEDQLAQEKYDQQVIRDHIIDEEKKKNQNKVNKLNLKIVQYQNEITECEYQIKQIQQENKSLSQINNKLAIGLMGENKKNSEICCCICLEKRPEYMFEPCNHVVLCKECVSATTQVNINNFDLILGGQNKQCPICKMDINLYKKIFV